MTFDQALEALKDAWIERCLLGGSAQLTLVYLLLDG